MKQKGNAKNRNLNTNLYSGAGFDDLADAAEKVRKGTFWAGRDFGQGLEPRQPRIPRENRRVTSGGGGAPQHHPGGA